MPSLEAMVQDFQANFAKDPRKSCLICDSEHHELVDILLKDGASGVKVCRFLRDRLGLQISNATLYRPRDEHLRGDSEKR